MSHDAASLPAFVDAHQHFWTVARGDYHWMTPEAGVLYRDYSPQDLEPHLRSYGISASILVQAAQTLEETRFLLDIAEQTPFIAGVVGWVDFTSPDAPNEIAGLSRNSLLVGLRPMVQDIDDDDWLLRKELRPAIEAMIEHKLVFDALIFPRHLPRLACFLDRYPDLPVVLDHAAKPFIQNGILDPWRKDISEIAMRPRTLCKISGLVTEARQDWSTDDLKPYVAHIRQAFGPDRLMWGSDWPVVEKAGGYRAWREAAETLLSDLSPVDTAKVFGGNAARFYLTTRGRSVSYPRKLAGP